MAKWSSAGSSILYCVPLPFDQPVALGSINRLSCTAFTEDDFLTRINHIENQIRAVQKIHVSMWFSGEIIFICRIYTNFESENWNTSLFGDLVARRTGFCGIYRARFTSPSWFIFNSTSIFPVIDPNPPNSSIIGKGLLIPMTMKKISTFNFMNV